MRPRQDLVEIFSTFLQFDADAFHRWITDPKLRRSMQSCLALFSEDSSDTFWALYWHHVWRTQASSLAVAHLTAYLQEACYWVAKKMARNQMDKHSVADFFQTAIARVDNILKGFNPQLSSNLKSYAELAFRNAIKKLLYQQRETDICTDWSLLHKLSQKRLVESLQYAGVNQETIAQYVLAWNCFRELYAPSDIPTAHRLGKPDYTTWQEITRLYNSERLSQLRSSSSTCRPETLESWLLTCAKAVRSCQYPSYVSLDAPSLGQETGELLDRLPANVGESLLTEAITQEEAKTRDAQMVQMSQALADAIAKLDPQAQALLQAYYGQDLTQQQIAQQLGVKQYAVSRQLTRLRQKLLLVLAQWSQQTLHITLTSEVLDNMGDVLEEWLKARYCPSDFPSSPESQ